MRKITQIVVHASATPKGEHFDVEDIRAWHKAKGWSDIGYHFVILLNGTIQYGRDINTIGAHVLGHNTNSVGICYIGGKYGEDTRTILQQVSLVYLIGTLKRLYTKAEVLGHRDFSPDLDGDGTIEPNEWMKLCPSFDAKNAYKNL